ncbi:cytochrome C oxidase subunit III [Hyphomicrobium denitrificans 1NES1]|uniref:Cytochrome C oxidase subunit III n=1 Tax=Hyphomicrobium denitrificans 1NES1 TaxID=670307 RepID=N0B000_9HYPH|nr:cytochrome c oxidase subunit 3 [Hyphomicrobium denitrificans]AGK56779.1 cytochrome C oxidase subunit III [Hyphomicrobium denitrificans 1NES1]
MTLAHTYRESEKRVSQTQTADWGPLSGLPGNPMIWILILGELAVFGALLLGFSVARVLDPATFAASQIHLHRLLGGLNTLVLVTSGFLVAAAIWRRREGHDARLLLALGMLLGAVFLAIKGVEYGQLFAAGFDIETNTFFQLYFLITGFHAVHIVLGLTIFGIVSFADSIENLETGAAFWHMLDMVWVMIYPIIYLVH